MKIEPIRSAPSARSFDSKHDRPQDFEQALNEAVGASKEGDVELTETERRFDDLVAARRAKGRETYGTGLDHRAHYNWMMMALEEALDLSQYLMARVVELEHAIEGKER